MIKKIAFCLIFLFCKNIASSQTCCSGGVPVSSNLGLPSAEGKTLQLNLSYDLNNLNTLKTEREVIDDQTRKRTTQSILLEIGYSLTDKLSIDAFFSYVRQERIINNNDLTSTNGIGDMVFLLKYQLKNEKKNGYNFFIGAGSKIPVGASDLRNNNGITLNADLQPGSGAFDWIGWGQWSKTLDFRPSMQIASTFIFSHKGVNNNYLGDSEYQFGREWSWSLGVSNQLLVGKQLIQPALQFRYRDASADLFNSDALPSTGGNWLFIIPGGSIWFGKNFSLETNVEFPLFAKVEGTQVTPTYRWNIGMFYKIPFSKNVVNNIDSKLKF